MRKRIVMCLAVCLCILPYHLAAAPFDGSAPMLCAVIDVFECTATGSCQRGTAESVNIPQFMRINTAEKTLSSTGDNVRKTTVQRVDRLDGRLILQGGEHGWG